MHCRMFLTQQLLASISTLNVSSKTTGNFWLGTTALEREDLWLRELNFKLHDHRLRPEMHDAVGFSNQPM